MCVHVHLKWIHLAWGKVQWWPIVNWYWIPNVHRKHGISWQMYFMHWKGSHFITLIMLVQSYTYRQSLTAYNWQLSEGLQKAAETGFIFFHRQVAGSSTARPFDILINLSAPELFFLILAHPVHKMWIIQDPKTLELWNKLHFEKKKTESILHV